MTADITTVSRVPVPVDQQSQLNSLPKSSDPSLYVAPSRIPEAGNGLFAHTAISRDSVVTRYTGSILSTGEAMRLEDKCYLMRLGNGIYVDGNPNRPIKAVSAVEGGTVEDREVLNQKALQEGQGDVLVAESEESSGKPSSISSSCSLASYLNDCKPYNCYFVKRPEAGCADVVALRDIEPGEELYVSYGKMYWAGHNLTAGPKNKKDAVDAA
ncbi:unnamed protein product [Amoebophrya sp. A25]|nr:unnamed protein product [Amoebophrya sp. A25]|eukprot:GSA25T00026957001.1